MTKWKWWFYFVALTWYAKVCASLLLFGTISFTCTLTKVYISLESLSLSSSLLQFLMHVIRSGFLSNLVQQMKYKKKMVKWPDRMAQEVWLTSYKFQAMKREIQYLNAV